MTDEKDDPDLPYLPYPDWYAGSSSGHSGSDTSRERAERDDASGRTSKRQRLVLSLLADVGPQGLTWRELSNLTGMHHGQASGVLSNLHAARRIVRLDMKRGRCHPYVLPELVGDREVQPFGGKNRPSLAEVWDAGFYTGLQFDGEDGQQPSNPYRS